MKIKIKNIALIDQYNSLKEFNILPLKERFLELIFFSILYLVNCTLALTVNPHNLTVLLRFLC
jgi:hypothetical protein